MTMFHPKLADLVRRDPRYAYEAYEFVFSALAHTQKMLGRAPQEEAEPSDEHHVSGAELVRGACDLAQHEFGMMAPTVFKQWGINRSDDFGEIVFNLIEANLMSKTSKDCKADFQNVIEIERALKEGFAIRLDEAQGL
jgi:uncharacterized repeat protein (TIGR04138 family)